MSEQENAAGPDAARPEPAQQAENGSEPSAAPEPSTALSKNARRELARLAELAIADHPDVYQGIHAELQAALVAIDDA